MTSKLVRKAWRGADFCIPIEQQKRKANELNDPGARFLGLRVVN